MHNAAFQAVGLNAVYVPFHVKADSKGALKAAVEAVRAMNMLGVNVTIPHKERVFKFLDEADEHAIDIGAVNTIVNRDGRLFGYNTDGAGYLLSLRKDTGFRPVGKRVVIIGGRGGKEYTLFMSGLVPGLRSAGEQDRQEGRFTGQRVCPEVPRVCGDGGPRACRHGKGPQFSRPPH
jgi:shikimate dehydrogenase